jgi:folate-binding protein YgfZ
LLDCAADQAQALARRLAMYKLRSRIEISDLSGSLAVAAIWGEAEPPAYAQGRIFADPRTPAMGWRMIAPPSELEVLGNYGEAAYEAHRIACAVPRGGLDFPWGDAFPHEANMDRLHGIDFRKGCYVGQEVVSRVEHRGLARKRIVGVRLDGPAPEIGAPVQAGEIAIGAMGSSVGETGLAILRLDRAEEARAAGVALLCGATGIELIEAPTA